MQEGDSESHDLDVSLIQNEHAFEEEYDDHDNNNLLSSSYEIVSTQDDTESSCAHIGCNVEDEQIRSFVTVGDAQGDDAILNDENHKPFPLFSVDQNDNLHVNNFYITMPWSPQVYFTVRGAENFHIYLWIAKDLSWTRDAYIPAMTFGTASLLWCVVLMYHAVTAKCITEVYMLIVMILWIAGNFLWMSGEWRNDYP